MTSQFMTSQDVLDLGPRPKQTDAELAEERRKLTPVGGRRHGKVLSIDANRGFGMVQEDVTQEGFALAAKVVGFHDFNNVVKAGDGAALDFEANDSDVIVSVFQVVPHP